MVLTWIGRRQTWAQSRKAGGQDRVLYLPSFLKDLWVPMFWRNKELCYDIALVEKEGLHLDKPLNESQCLQLQGSQTNSDWHIEGNCYLIFQGALKCSFLCGWFGSSSLSPWTLVSFIYGGGLMDIGTTGVNIHNDNIQKKEERWFLSCVPLLGWKKHFSLIF